MSIHRPEGHGVAFNAATPTVFGGSAAAAEEGEPPVVHTLRGHWQPESAFVVIRQVLELGDPDSHLQRRLYRARLSVTAAGGFALTGHCGADTAAEWADEPASEQAGDGHAHQLLPVAVLQLAEWEAAACPFRCEMLSINGGDPSLSGLFLGESVPAAELEGLVPRNPIKWVLVGHRPDSTAITRAARHILRWHAAGWWSSCPTDRVSVPRPRRGQWVVMVRRLVDGAGSSGRDFSMTLAISRTRRCCGSTFWGRCSQLRWIVAAAAAAVGCRWGRVAVKSEGRSA